jgi:hypothetical protein
LENSKEKIAIGKAAKIGAALFALWGVLHIWVGYEGIHQYIIGGAPGLWNTITGGINAPHSAFQHTTDAVTANAQAHLLLNFCIDVAGYGVLGFVVAWLLWTRGSWLGYFLGLVIIGIADLTFFFTLVTPGIIELSLATVSGPAIWFFAIVVTPFGLSKFGNMKIE